MKVDLEKLEGSQKTFDFLIDSNEIDFEGEEIQPVGEINFEAKLIKGIVQTDIEGKISTDVEVECSRCLQSVTNSLEIAFDVSFISAEKYSDEKERELDDDELEVSFLENNEIDLNELIREQIILAIPAQILCKEDCKGLCDVCGKNQNLINCNCEEKETDPRWSGLKDLKFKK